jgi:hypothetical protein
MFHWNWFILVTIITTIQKSLWIIICHRSNSNSKSFFIVCFAPFQCFVCLYLVVFLLHLFNVFLLLSICILLWTYLTSRTFHWHFAYQIKNAKININERQWNIMKFIKFCFWKDRIDRNKIIMPTKYHLIIITSSAKKHITQFIMIS